MIIVYKKKAIPSDFDLIDINNLFFNKYTVELLDDKARTIISSIDKSELIDKYSIGSRFDGTRLNIDKLSTGCKTTLNILYNPDKVFNISECGENALDIIYSLKRGNVYCDYPMISFNMVEVGAMDPEGYHIFKDYEELKEWWKNEN